MKNLIVAVAVLLSVGCASARAIVVPASAYEKAFDSAVSNAKRLGYVPVTVDRAKGKFTSEKVCGCTDLVITFTKQDSGEFAVKLAGGALWSTFHHEAVKIEDAILAAGGRVAKPKG